MTAKEMEVPAVSDEEEVDVEGVFASSNPMRAGHATVLEVDHDVRSSTKRASNHSPSLPEADMRPNPLRGKVQEDEKASKLPAYYPGDDGLPSNIDTKIDMKNEVPKRPGLKLRKDQGFDEDQISHDDHPVKSVLPEDKIRAGKTLGVRDRIFTGLHFILSKTPKTFQQNLWDRCASCLGSSCVVLLFLLASRHSHEFLLHSGSVFKRPPGNHGGEGRLPAGARRVSVLLHRPSLLACDRATLI